VSLCGNNREEGDRDNVTKVDVRDAEEFAECFA
jgi:hypothetical protein